MHAGYLVLIVDKIQTTVGVKRVSWDSTTQRAPLHVGQIAMSNNTKKLLAARNVESGRLKQKAELSLGELENLFITKFQEKYQLIPRDIQRAFKAFDKDCNNAIDLSEFAQGISLYLNGVDIRLVEELVKCYDVDGDGTINLDEFTKFLISRTSPDKEKWLTVDSIRTISKGAKVAAPDRPDSVGSFRAMSTHDRGQRHEKAEREGPMNSVENLYEISSVLTSENNYSEISTNNVNDKVKSIEYKVKMLLSNIKSFLIRQATEMRNSGKIGVKERLSAQTSVLIENNARNLLAQAFVLSLAVGRRAVDYNSFKRVVARFQNPGTQPPKDEVYRSLFDICSNDDDDVTDGMIPDILMALVFDKGADAVNKFGFAQIALPAANTGRKSVASGPIEAPKNTDQFEVNMKNVPFRFITRHARSALAVPSNFKAKYVSRSNTMPSQECGKSFVFGLNANNLYSGKVIHNLSSADSTRHIVLYASATLGVLHDINSNKQTFLEGHTDNITCIELSPNHQFVATGRTGKSPEMLVYDVGDSSRRPLYRMGKKFFERGVTAIAFSSDSMFVTACSCDDKHMMGVWSMTTGELIASAPVQNGVPPQVFDACWSPVQAASGYICKEHTGTDNDIIVTVCDRSLKYWSFKRPSKDTRGKESSLLQGRSSRMAAGVKEGAPKKFTCAVFYGADSASIVAAGGDNGFLYCFRDSECFSANLIISGGISCIQVAGNNLFVGGAKGVIKVVDRSYNVLQVFSAIPVAEIESNETSGMVSAIGMSSRPKARMGATPRTATATAAKTSVKISQKEEVAIPEGSKCKSTVTGMALQFEGDGSVGTIVAATCFGRLVKVSYNLRCNASTYDTVAYYHTGPVWGLAVKNTLFCTGGDDRWLCLWDSTSRQLLTRCRCVAPIRCIDFSGSPYSGFLAIGCAVGVIVIYNINIKEERKTETAFERIDPILTYKLAELTRRRDCKEDISDIKFSPNSKMLAVGSHDNYIDIYSTNLLMVTKNANASCDLKYLKRMAGHSSYITHLDWSCDNRLLQSTCGAYELLYWDVSSGKQMRSTHDAIEGDTIWDTHSCVLGFNLMGVWEKYCDGTDINSVDVSKRLGVCVTGDDYGKLNLFNYPCVTKDAPHKSYLGHSSHVMNIKFLLQPSSNSSESSKNFIVSAGGNDMAAILWEII